MLGSWCGRDETPQIGDGTMTYDCIVERMSLQLSYRRLPSVAASPSPPAALCCSFILTSRGPLLQLHPHLPRAPIPVPVLQGHIGLPQRLGLRSL